MTRSWIDRVESADGEKTQFAQSRSALRHGFDGIATAAGRLADTRTPPARLRLARNYAAAQGIRRQLAVPLGVRRGEPAKVGEGPVVRH
jgi:hypothetical protein